jgi:hypothetical protein
MVFYGFRGLLQLCQAVESRNTCLRSSLRQFRAFKTALAEPGGEICGRVSSGLLTGKISPWSSDLVTCPCTWKTVDNALAQLHPECSLPDKRLPIAAASAERETSP